MCNPTQPSGERSPGCLRASISRISAIAFALLAAAVLAVPNAGAAPAQPEVAPQSANTPRIVAHEDRKDAFDGGLTPRPRTVIFPSLDIGLMRERPIPIGVTCSCTIDRVGLTSQFDLTVIEVIQDATYMVQQLNRFNRLPRPGFRYVAAYVGQQYIAGPENQAYTTTEADWKATGNDERLSDAAQLLHNDVEFRPRADVYPGNYVNGWLIYELPVNRPAYLVWNYNFVGERGIWFALQ